MKSRSLNTYSFEKAVQAHRIDELGDIEKKEGKQKVPGVGIPDDVHKFCNIGLFQDKIKSRAGDQKLQQRFQQLFRIDFTVCQRSF